MAAILKNAARAIETGYDNIVEIKNEGIRWLNQTNKKKPAWLMVAGLVSLIAYNFLAGPVVTWGSRLAATLVLSPIPAYCLLKDVEHFDIPDHISRAIRIASFVFALSNLPFLAVSRAVPAAIALSLLYISSLNTFESDALNKCWNQWTGLNPGPGVSVSYNDDDRNLFGAPNPHLQQPVESSKKREGSSPRVVQQQQQQQQGSSPGLVQQQQQQGPTPGPFGAYQGKNPRLNWNNNND